MMELTRGKIMLIPIVILIVVGYFGLLKFQEHDALFVLIEASAGGQTPIVFDV